MQKPGIATIVWVLVVVWLGLSSASASITTPVLALSRASTATSASEEVLKLDAIFPHAGVVQTTVELWVLVRSLDSGGAFALYTVPGGAFEGALDLLDDGLQGADVPVLMAGGDASLEGRLLFLGAERIDLRLPHTLPPGPAEAQLFLFDADGAVLSNAVGFEVQGLDLPGDLP